MADSSPWVDQAQKLWALWDLRVSNAVFGAIEGAFGVEIRANPCPHTYDLPAVKTPTILVTWALIYLVIVGLGLVTITPADKTKKVRAPPLSPFTSPAWKVQIRIPIPRVSKLLHLVGQ